jgi:orotate phosphoribosyltransferase
MNDDDIKSVFRSHHALRDGHFLLASGLHSPAYVQCARLLERPVDTGRMCAVLAEKIIAQNLAPNLIIGPAYGGILVAYALTEAIARQTGDETLVAQYAERVDGKLTLRRGFGPGTGAGVLVAEDVVTTGGSAQETIEMLRKDFQANPIGVAALIDRTKGANPFDIPFIPLLRLDLPTYKPDACPMCRDGKPLETPGRKQLAG